MVFAKIRSAWEKRAQRNLIKKAGKEDWGIFAKALCSSTNTCHGFPYECKTCFDAYFKSPSRMLQRSLEQ